MSGLPKAFDVVSQSAQFFNDVGSSPKRSLVFLPSFELPEQSVDSS